MYLSDIYRMIGVITGDIINSREKGSPKEWLGTLKRILSKHGKSPKIWEIYRGDSFQLEVARPELSLISAIRIKATIKCIQGIDVRMAIGIGSKEYNAAKISQSNGAAFVYSGDRFDQLKAEKQNLSIKTSWEDFDKEMNLVLRLGLVIMDRWSLGAAEMVKTVFDNPGKGQTALAKLLGIGQSAVSERQKRAHLTEILSILNMFEEKVKRNLTS